ncbi:hypothetical protein FALBO_6974 [Fusarium albosuccineum]|uniref:Uncharacterized protein n=1 Tax=Fusarium albosuccineum TaxID=1237068 RepID=A0A8H4LDS0_9HYPO|nr:hypothetical protein FALBO_6974 [Fusarium albosuccineum]
MRIASTQAQNLRWPKDSEPQTPLKPETNQSNKPRRLLSTWLSDTFFLAPFGDMVALQWKPERSTKTEKADCQQHHGPTAKKGAAASESLLGHRWALEAMQSVQFSPGNTLLPTVYSKYRRRRLKLAACHIPLVTPTPSRPAAVPVNSGSRPNLPFPPPSGFAHFPICASTALCMAWHRISWTLSRGTGYNSAISSSTRPRHSRANWPPPKGAHPAQPRSRYLGGQQAPEPGPKKGPAAGYPPKALSSTPGIHLSISR